MYWYNGLIVSSEIARGLDIFELVPSPLISQNEIDAAKTVQIDYLNAQGQRKFVWPPSFAMARAFVDQLERSKGLAAARITAVRSELAAAEKQSGAAAPHRADSACDAVEEGRHWLERSGENPDAHHVSDGPRQIACTERISR